jgi:hypothetical protein
LTKKELQNHIDKKRKDSASEFASLIKAARDSFNKEEAIRRELNSELAPFRKRLTDT